MTTVMSPAPERASAQLARFDSRVAFDSLPFPLVFLLPAEPNFVIVEANRSYLDVAHLSRDEIIGGNFSSIFHARGADPISIEILERSFKKVFSSGNPDTVFPLPPVFVQETPNEEDPCAWSAINSPVFSESGAMSYISHRLIKTWPVANDEISLPASGELAQSTESLRSENLNLRETIATLETLVKETNVINHNTFEFLSNIGHEIRTPLAAILGFSQLLERDLGITGERREFVESILASGEHLMSLINDLLDASKMESGKFVLSVLPFNIIDLLKEVATMFFPRCMEKGLQIQVSIPTDFPKTIKGDSLRFRQIVINLLSNAVKFTTRGVISLRAKVLHRTGIDVTFTISVIDTGIGIALEDLPRLFRRFEQVGSRRIGGTGLGLYISNELAKMMNGKITVSSQLGIGSEFVAEFTLPTNGMPGVAPAVEIVHVRSEFADSPIMIVDDVEFNRLILSRFLKDLGFSNVTEAESGNEAIELARVKPFSVILMDVYMPEMDGISATKAIREFPIHYHTPVIGISASVVDDTKLRQCHEAFGAFITKPFKFIEVQNALDLHCGFKFDPVSLETGGVHVLIVDDQVIMRRLISIELRKDSIDVDQCGSGREAIERIKSTKFDIVLIDRLMPELDGIETTRLIRSIIPNPPAVVIMSSDWQPDEILAAKAAGAFEILEKPVKVAEFKKIWDRIKASHH